MGDIDMGRIRLQINGEDIPEFVGLDDIQLGEDSEYNDGPGGVAFGFNDKGTSNKIQFTISIRQTSRTGLRKVLEHSLRKTPVTVHAFIPDDEQGIIANDELVEVLVSDARINAQGGPFKGDSPGDHTFRVMGRNGSVNFKGGTAVEISPEST